jgi:hypothetical protein
MPARKRTRPLLRAVSWVILTAAAAVIGDSAVQGTNSISARAVCAVKYFTQPVRTLPVSTNWAQYGVTRMIAGPARSFSIEPELLTDKWFGAYLNSPGTCDYRIDFDADLSRPLDSQSAAALGYGYAVGARGQVVDDVPHGTTVQFDPPFGGLRTVELPGDPNASGHNAQKYAFARPGRFNRWSLTVSGTTMTVDVDYQRYGSVDLSHAGSGEIILRVWNARLDVKNVEITKLGPWR